MHTTRTPRRGFTLIEMVVSIGIFVTVLFVASSAFLTVVNADRRSYATRVAVDNLTIALEDMTRRIKTGTGYASSDTAQFSFFDQRDVSTTYRFDSDQKKIFRRIGGAGELAVTPDEVEITNLSFSLSGHVPGDDKQPSVRIRLSGKTKDGMVDTPFIIQTLITQRAYDF